MTQRWFVTGVASGIGSALCDAILARGDIVVGTARRAEEARSFGERGPDAHGLVLDLDHHDAVAGVVAQAVDLAGGPIDIVVNNAGRSLWASVEETPIEAARALFETNVFGPMAVMQAFLPRFRERGQGIFVNMSSGCGLFGVPGVGAYCGSKFALEGLSETVALEASSFGVRVMLVEPGAVLTRFISHGTTEVGTPGGHYGFVDHGKHVLDDYYTEKAIRPEALAAEILAALDSGNPPPRLVIGDDTRPGARAKFQALADMLAD